MILTWKVGTYFSRQSKRGGQKSLRRKMWSTPVFVYAKSKDLSSVTIKGGARQRPGKLSQVG